MTGQWSRVTTADLKHHTQQLGESLLTWHSMQSMAGQHMTGQWSRVTTADLKHHTQQLGESLLTWRSMQSMADNTFLVSGPESRGQICCMTQWC